MLHSKHPFTCLFAAIGVVCAIAAADIANPPDLTRYEQVSPEVQARDGSLMRAFLSKGGYWRMHTSPGDVGPRYLAMLKAYEDRRFASHFGVDFSAMARAALQWVGAGHVISGGSTLTMQVARLLEPPMSRGIGAKLIQMIRAVQLEERYSKDEILSFYLTLAPFGGNLEGVKAASLSYFGKTPDRLDLAESALLVALPQSPVKQRPDRHAIAAKAGRDKVLHRMVEDGVIAEDDAKLAMAEGVPFARQDMPFLSPQLAGRLRLATGRTRIETTLDLRVQAAIESLAAEEARLSGDGASLAIVVVENRTRNVLAYVGGADFWGRAGQIDLAQARRSPGSALKPFIYGMAFDDLSLHPETLMKDEATLFGDYAPRDFEGAFQGAVTAREALRMSLNVPAVMILEKVGPLAFTLNLQNAGARLAFPHGGEAPSLPTALGGLGISPADLAMLYAAIPNGGEAKPLRYLKDAPDRPGHRLFGEVAAYYLTDILDGVSLPEGWAMGEGLTRRTIGFKTGTSAGYRDAWCAGFSPDYTVAVWVGRADGSSRPGHIGRETGAPILLKAFGLLPPDRHGAPPPPKGAILAANAAELPASMRVFVRRGGEPAHAAAVTPPPAISYPPNGTAIPLPRQDAKDQTILLKAEGGTAPLTWLADGVVLGSFGPFDEVPYRPKGEGMAHFTVVDDTGRSDSSDVRFIREK